MERALGEPVIKDSGLCSGGFQAGACCRRREGNHLKAAPAYEKRKDAGHD